MKQLFASGHEPPGKEILRALAMVLLTLLVPSHVFAVLGGSEASVQSDQVHMQASLRSMPAARYTVHEMRAPTGTVVREYASGGTVVGVAWEGKWPPDMRQLLGSYFDEYQRALEQQTGPRGRRPVHIALPGLVVNISGHPGSVAGQAFVPDMLPQGMAAKEIK